MHVTGGQELLHAPQILKKVGVHQGSVVADLGCGHLGHFVFPAADMVGDDGIVYAVDIQKSILESLKSKSRDLGYSTIRPIWSDLETYGAAHEIKDASVDYALLANTLFQMKDPKEAMREASRMLKKGGKLVIVDWKPQHAPFGPPIDHRIEKENVLEIGRVLNFSHTEVFEAGPYHFGVVFTR